MKTIHYVDVGYLEDTVIYELVPKVVARLKEATMSDVARALDGLKADNVLLESGVDQRVGDMLILRGGTVSRRIENVIHESATGRG